MKVRKVIAFVLMIALVLTAASAKSKKKKKSAEWWNSYGGGVEEHNILVDVGVGLHYNLLVDNLKWCIPSIEATAEFTQKVGEVPLGFGGFIGFAGYHTEKTTSVTVPGEGTRSAEEDYTRYATYFGGLVNYHFNFSDMFDIYAGSKIGIDIQNNTEEDFYNGVSVDDDKEVRPLFYWTLNAGATWYFTENFGLNVEVGGPVFARVAVSFKF